MLDGSVVSLSFGKEGASMGFGASYCYVTLAQAPCKECVMGPQASQGQGGLAKASPDDL